MSAGSASSSRLDDIRNIVLNTNKSTPIKVSNVADVEVGYAPRLGIVGKDNQNEVVTGIVLMRKYGNTLKTLKGVEAKVNELNTTGILPKGYKVVPYYDRTHTGRYHAAHRARESHHRDGAGVPGADFLSRQSARRNHRGNQHPARAMRRVRSDALRRTRPPI